jgi:hypothetical protein
MKYVEHSFCASDDKHLFFSLTLYTVFSKDFKLGKGYRISIETPEEMKRCGKIILGPNLPI